MTEKARPDDVPRIPGCTDVELVRSGLPRTYRCEKEGTGEPVTALVYPVRVDTGTAAEFTRQAQTLAAVQDPRVAPVLDVGLADGLPYVLSTPDAGTLAELISQRLRSPAELAELGGNLASGLAAIHSAGLVHGGLTPDTVVVGPGGGHLLAGLTLGLEQHTGHTALSSPRQLYLAPETLRDGTTTPRSDLYALGTVLHAAVTGRPPLAAKMGETAGDHILRVLHEPPARLEVLPDRFAELVAGLLEKDPARRPQDAEAVASALAELAPEPAPASAGPLPLLRPLARPVDAPPAARAHPEAPVQPAGPAQPTGPVQPAGPVQPTGPAGSAGPGVPSTPTGAPVPERTAESAIGTDTTDDTVTDAPTAPEQPARPAVPRPALMNRGRLPSVRSSAIPATDSSTNVAPPTGVDPNDVPPGPEGQPTRFEKPTEVPAAFGAPGFDREPPPAAAGPTEPPSAAAVPRSPQPESGAAPTAPPPDDPPDSGGPPNGRDHDPLPGPSRRRRRSWLVASAGLAVAVTLISVLAFASRQESDPDLEPEPIRADKRSPDPTPAPKQALDVRLNPPVDHGTSVDLSWTGDPGLEYAVVIAQVGKPTDLKLVYDRTKYRAPVVPGMKYCFAIQATDGIQTFETEPWPIRDAECEM